MLRRILPFALLPLLTGCINDGAAYRIDGSRHALTVVREQNLFWKKQVKLAVVVARMPDCQRKHTLQEADLSTPVELWQPGPGTFILAVGKNRYVTETRTCLGFAPLTEEPPGGIGVHLGTFAVKNGVFTFTPAARPEEAAAGSR